MCVCVCVCVCVCENQLDCCGLLGQIPVSLHYLVR